MSIALIQLMVFTVHYDAYVGGLVVLLSNKFDLI